MVSSLSTSKSDLPTPAFSASGSLGLFKHPAVRASLNSFHFSYWIIFAGMLYLKMLRYFCFSIPPRALLYLEVLNIKANTKGGNIQVLNCQETRITCLSLERGFLNLPWNMKNGSIECRKGRRDAPAQVKKGKSTGPDPGKAWQG